MDLTNKIEDPMTLVMLNKIGAKRISYLGALLQKWENMAAEGLSFSDWVINDDFVETTQRLCNTGADDIRDLGEKLAKTEEDLQESKDDIKRLIDVNKDLYAKFEQLEKRHPQQISIESVKSILYKFNKENPAAVADGGGVTFGGHVKIDSVESLASFLGTAHARELGVPSDILVTFKVFVLDGKLVTLSDEYHGGVGYSFLWTKNKRKNKKHKKQEKQESVEVAVGWATETAKKYDPRLMIDPVTGVNYVDPETGRYWVHPVLVDSGSGSESESGVVSGSGSESGSESGSGSGSGASDSSDSKKRSRSDSSSGDSSPVAKKEKETEKEEEKGDVFT